MGNGRASRVWKEERIYQGNLPQNTPINGCVVTRVGLLLRVIADLLYGASASFRTMSIVMFVRMKEADG